jgi:trigger factor
MQIEKEIKRDQNAKVSIQVTVGKSSVHETHEEIIRDFEKGAKLPGFRKGKVPRLVVLSRFSKGIKDETINTVLSKSIQKILKDENFKPISDPLITEMGDLTMDEDFSFKTEFDVMPEIEINEYKGISSERYIYTVNKELVNSEIENLRERFATLISMDEKAKIGHYVVIDYEETTPEGTKKEKKDQTIFLDNKDDQLAKQLVGLEKGEEKDITLKSSSTDKEKEYSIQLHVKVNDVKKKELPELNDDFAKDISDVDTLEELREKVKKSLEQEAKRFSEEKTKVELLNKLIEKTDIGLPETMINSEIDRLLYEISSTYQIDFETIKKDVPKYQGYRKNLMPRAVNNLKQELILAEVGKKENIQVTDKEIEEEIKNYACTSKKDFETVKNSMEENDSIRSLKYRLRLNKALEFLSKNANLEKERKLKYGEDESEGGKK